ncbi:carboxypeptidase-like regulatory domain-containing protein [Galbibacter pacificus]|uniref:Carboxypeptidase-like regulatory domain-containing protein n=1 Tax=Galbibacter pacificus TaxID=2996052 RepID=A0ABT6FV83_9FLAO|nr:carboxypeptidase-like regulatory domain-containing protein [Galbibacter pacificus]MDG3583908.1 carboxypeptidase-like regulatory domain-containing protein [Galbibacter pacificus]MDG3587174.1 carboxypeptidase-like regulatory domain-containing protein [Galbibacter pacificus]
MLGRLLIGAILLIAVHGVSAQQVILKGELVDQGSKEKIPYAHLIFTDVAIGTTSNKNGRFFLNIPKELLVKNVRISCIGYQDKVIPANQLGNATISLKKRVEELGEVVLVNNSAYHHKKNLNPFKNKRRIGLGNFSGGLYPSVLARYYPNNMQLPNPAYMDEVTIFFDEHYVGNSKFRLRVLSATDSLSPGEDLIRGNLIITSYKYDRKIQVDLSGYSIKVPDNGFFIAVEHLFIKENSYEEKIDVRLNDSIYKNVGTIRYGPIFKGVEEDKDVSNSYYMSNKGWKSMKELNIPQYGSMFKEGKIASPAFKVKVVY